MSELHGHHPISPGAATTAPRPDDALEPPWSFVAPRDGAASGRLEIVSGATWARITADSAMPDLCRARFEGAVPEVRAEAGTVTIRYPRHSLVDWFKDALRSDRDAATIALTTTIPWRIEVDGGVSRLTADLGGLRLASLRVGGGASRAVLTLPRPAGVVPVRFGGGASHLTILRPVGVAARLRVRSGASGLTLDEQSMGAVGGQVRWQSLDFAGATDRYEIEIAGGASDLTVATRA